MRTCSGTLRLNTPLRPDTSIASSISLLLDRMLRKSRRLYASRALAARTFMSSFQQKPITSSFFTGRGMLACARGSSEMCDMLSLPFGSLITALYTALRLRMNTLRCGVSSSSSSSNLGRRILRVRGVTHGCLLRFFSLSSSSLLYPSHVLFSPTLDSCMARGPLRMPTSSFIFSLYLPLTHTPGDYCSTSSPSSSSSRSFSSTRRYSLFPPRMLTSHSSCRESRLLRQSRIFL